LWKLSPEDRLAFPFKKDLNNKVNLKRIDDAFMRCLSFFIFTGELMGISGARVVGSSGQCLPSRLWPADSLCYMLKDTITSLTLRKNGDIFGKQQLLMKLDP